MSRHNVGIVFATYILIIVHPSIVQANDKAGQIDELMQTYHRYGLFNGSVLVAQQGKVIFKKGYGDANMEWGIPNQPDTKFRIGSITKQFTATLILQLVEQGRIQLDGNIVDYLPNYRKDTGEKITIHHLLTHTSGIPSFTGLPGFRDGINRDPHTVDEMVQQYCSGDLEFEPSARFRYNNSGYFLLGAIIEAVTGKTYEEVLHERILDPLDMNATGYDWHDQIIENRAAGYTVTYEGYENASYLDMSVPYAAGSMYSSVEDLHRWDRALYSEKLLSKKYRDLLFKPQVEALGRHYAYGWFVGNVEVPDSTKTVKVIGHSGGINGFATLIRRLVDDRHLVVLFSNTRGGTSFRATSKGIVNILYDEPYELPKEPVSTVLKKILSEKGMDAVVEEYRSLKEKQDGRYDVGEGELIRLGYQLLAAEKPKEAIGIFELCTEANPESAAAHNGLGEAFMAEGDRKQAIRHFARMLALNPDSSNAANKLNELLNP